MAIVQSQNLQLEQLDYQGLKDALNSAGEDLVKARRAKDMKAVIAALDVVVRCNLQMGDTFAANLAATDELAMIRRSSKDKVAEAKALNLVAEVHSTRGDASGAVKALEEASTIIAGVADEKALQAKVLEMLAFAKLAVGKFAEALTPAEDARKIYGELQDMDGHQKAERALNMVYAQKQQLDKAPGRQDALGAIKELADALESKSSIAWTSAMELLERNGAFTQKDLDEVINAAIENDRMGAGVFLREQGINVANAGDSSIIMTSIPQRFHDMNMRMGGMGYGTSFRCARVIFSATKRGDTGPHPNQALTAFHVASGGQAWERDLMYHPGSLDSMLQTSGYGY